MSHFTNIKTNLNNLFYLEKSLERLKIKYKREKFKSGFLSHEKYYIDLLIEQSNGYDIKLKGIELNDFRNFLEYMF
jgi:hypothetical protein